MKQLLDEMHGLTIAVGPNSAGQRQGKTSIVHVAPSPSHGSLSATADQWLHALGGLDIPDLAVFFFFSFLFLQKAACSPLMRCWPGLDASVALRPSLVTALRHLGGGSQSAQLSFHTQNVS